MEDSKKNKIFTLIFGLVFLVIGIGLSIFTVKEYFKDQEFLKTAKTIEGTITSIRTVADDEGGGSTYTPIISYVVDDITYEYISGASSSIINYKVGDSVTLIYNPRDPSEARRNETFSFDNPVFFLSCISLMFLIVPILIIKSVLKTKVKSENKQKLSDFIMPYFIVLVLTVTGIVLVVSSLSGDLPLIDKLSYNTIPIIFGLFFSSVGAYIIIRAIIDAVNKSLEKEEVIPVILSDIKSFDEYINNRYIQIDAPVSRDSSILIFNDSKKEQYLYAVLDVSSYVIGNTYNIKHLGKKVLEVTNSDAKVDLDILKINETDEKKKHNFFLNIYIPYIGYLENIFLLPILYLIFLIFLTTLITNGVNVNTIIMLVVVLYMIIYDIVNKYKNRQ